MLSFLLLFSTSKELNSEGKLEVDKILHEKYDKMQKQLDLLENLKNEVISLKKLRNENVPHAFGDEVKPIALVGINKERTLRFEESKLWPFGDYETISAESRAPILHYKLITSKPNQRTFATKIKIDFPSKLDTNIKQCIFRFINATQSSNEVSYETQPVDFPQIIGSKIIDLETEVEFTELYIDVLLNWGNDFYTSIPKIEIIGPVHGINK